jgi:DNA-binding transcriptional MerR regulator
MAGLWTIGELAMAVEQALATTAYPGQKSGRIRDVPDRRTIRYYATIGLLDKPAEMRGRTAYYGRRHLLQLVAIKRLQASGKSLVEIQTALAGADDSTLAKWSVLPKESWESTASEASSATSDVPPVAANASAPPAREDFWAAAPAATRPEPAAKDAPSTSIASALHLKLMENVTLVIEGVDVDKIDAETLSRLRPALEDLRTALQKNGGIVGHTPENGRTQAKESEQNQSDADRGTTQK